ncbi:DNA/RNA helicase domain-containing protein [Amycolatopsis sp. 195334CR]|uniref:DNA/RNA helicase domain-containing protein n=1 Tax=Amycolatopsis sp. 195334CR TaxID=2814588 RepID=UPI0027DD607F|nr:DNA/RNA helicase domain-containing protein [Amycolatopsis sp. 195334CR]
MTPIRGTARELRQGTAEDRLVRKLAEWTGATYSRADKGEAGAWRNSLPVLLDLLCHAGLGHVQVLLEYRLPYCPRRVDAVLCGVRPDDGQPSYVLVELKQWSSATSAGPGLVEVPHAEQPLLHPAEQVRRYCRYLLDYTPSLAKRPSRVKGLAFLHNAARPTWDLADGDFGDFGQLYTADGAGDLVARLRSLFSTDPATAGDAKKVAEELITVGHHPSRNLLQSAAEVFAGRDDFVLLDEQQVAFDLVRNTVQLSQEQDHVPKKVIVVRGGPGSGKSAIAVSLLNALAGQRLKVMHATGSRAFTETLKAQVAAGEDRFESIFTYFNQFGRDDNDRLDVLICDEAHRIRDDIPRAHWDRGLPQIGKLIKAAKVPVFLLDDEQKVRPNEIDTRDTIQAAADRLRCPVEEIRLDGQFRCGGSDRFDQWVRRLLGIASDGPVTWTEFSEETEDEYVVDTVASPSALEDWLKNQMLNFSGTARMTAGFCWKWSNPRRVDGELQLVDDVRVGDWKKPWNLKQDKKVPGVPSASLWASDPAGFGQIGCIYTAQGFEYDWAGVIFGPDLVIRDGQWVADRDKTEDGSLSKVDPERFSELVRNTYKVLMTRGMKGVCLFSVDRETNDFLREYAR